jgi:hypothetical protein
LLLVVVDFSVVVVLPPESGALLLLVVVVLVSEDFSDTTGASGVLGDPWHPTAKVPTTTEIATIPMKVTALVFGFLISTSPLWNLFLSLC